MCLILHNLIYQDRFLDEKVKSLSGGKIKQCSQQLLLHCQQWLLCACLKTLERFDRVALPAQASGVPRLFYALALVVLPNGESTPASTAHSAEQIVEKRNENKFMSLVATANHFIDTQFDSNTHNIRVDVLGCWKDLPSPVKSTHRTTIRGELTFHPLMRAKLTAATRSESVPSRTLSPSSSTYCNKITQHDHNRVST